MLHRIAASEVHLSDKLMTARAHLICSDDCPLAWLEREPDAEECKILLDKIAQIKKLDVRAGIRVLLAAISKADHVTNRVSNAQRAFLTALSLLR